MSSMGLGAWLSRFIEQHLEKAFILLQMSIAVLGGFSTFILFYAFAYIGNYEAFLYIVTIALGTMLGIEIPLIILFPLVLVPQLGLMQTSFLFGGLL